ncbi:YqaA family protein [Methylobacter sp.]|uniref:YqaA family protein n=1 Tax=Methylobacter sp. TaxID=2051955 RepID=UPI002FDDAA16
MTAYLGLFGVSFLAATLIPFYSEVALVGLLAAGYDPWLLWLFASAGNTLGAVVNWVLGRYLLYFEHRRWFPFPSSKLHRYQRWYQHFGVWSLLLAWLPVGGDALTFIAGIMRVHLGIFLILVGFGKSLRYAVIILLSGQIF